MTLPRIAVLFTGGTISMLPDPATGAARPVLDGAAILARTPGAAVWSESQMDDAKRAVSRRMATVYRWPTSA